MGACLISIIDDLPSPPGQVECGSHVQTDSSPGPPYLQGTAL